MKPDSIQDPVIRAIVFDLDGTLVDAFDDIAAAVNHGLQLLGRPSRPTSEIRGYVGNGLHRLAERVLGADPASASLADSLTEMTAEYYREHPADFAREYPGASEVLHELHRRGFRIAILSNKRHELTIQVLKRLGLNRWIHRIQGEVPGQPHKPDPTSYLEILREFKVAPEETLIVGDGEPDAELARRTGSPFAAVSHGLLTSDRLRELGACIVLNDLRDLPGLLRGGTLESRRS